MLSIGVKNKIGGRIREMAKKTYWLETLGCPKNQVDSDKLEGVLIEDGMSFATSPEKADLVLVNTCAFIEDSRTESLEVIAELGERKKSNARLVVTGCMAERYGDELKDSAEHIGIDKVAGFGVPVTPVSIKSPIRFSAPTQSKAPSFDLLNLPRPQPKAPWAYLKVAEGCDKKCGYCAIPSFRGQQRSRAMGDILKECEAITASGQVKEIILVAQDLASYMKDVAHKKDTLHIKDRATREKNELNSRNSKAKSPQPIIELLEEVTKLTEWVRLLYLYPSDLTPQLIETICKTKVPYFDLSLQHASRELLKKMRRFGGTEIFLNKISAIRELAPEAVFRSNFIVGYPGETEKDHEELIGFIEEARLDWAAFFLYSEEEGTYSACLPDKVPAKLAAERRAELQSTQLEITEDLRAQLVGTQTKVLVEAEGEARSFREAPEIDGIIHVPESLRAGKFYEVKITGVSGCDLHAEPI